MGSGSSPVTQIRQAKSTKIETTTKEYFKPIDELLQIQIQSGKSFHVFIYIVITIKEHSRSILKDQKVIKED